MAIQEPLGISRWQPEHIKLNVDTSKCGNLCHCTGLTPRKLVRLSPQGGLRLTMSTHVLESTLALNVEDELTVIHSTSTLGANQLQTSLRQKRS
jgi:hypothetical protein